jgi:hypothetical protein
MDENPLKWEFPFSSAFLRWTKVYGYSACQHIHEELDQYSNFKFYQVMIVTPNSIIQSTRRSGEA